MKILYIITQADGGGAQKYTLTLAKHFGGVIAAGNEAGRLFDDAEKLPSSAEASEGKQLTTYRLQHLRRAISPWHDLMAMWEMRQLIKNYAPDIVHLNSTKAGILGSFAAIGLKTKVVFTAHGFRHNEPMSWFAKSFYLALEKVASSYRDYIICVSEADHKSALDNNLISADKISTIHNGLEQIGFLAREEARQALSLADDKTIIGCVANFYRTKGVDVLVDAVAILSDEIKAKILVYIIGDGQERKNLELRILSAGGGSASGGNYELGNTIKLKGKIENASRYLKAFDVLVLPSRKEGFPFVLLEAMQAGLPVIATDVGGISEALGDAGVLVEPENPGGLADAVKNLVFDNGKQKNLSQLALERAKLFTQEKMLEETKKIYEKITSAPAL